MFEKQQLLQQLKWKNQMETYEQGLTIFCWNSPTGLTNVTLPRKLGPKRANNIKKLFGLKKEDDPILVKKSVIRRTFKTAKGKDRVKSAKIQRLITPERIIRKKAYKVIIYIQLYYWMFQLFFAAGGNCYNYPS